MNSLSRRDRRTLGFGTIVVGLVLLGGRGVPRWFRWVDETRSRTAAAVRRLDEMRQSIGNRSAVAAMRLDANRAYLSLAPRLLEGESAATTAAALLSSVSGAAVRTGLAAGSIEALGDSARVGEFVRVTVQGEATGDVTGLSDFLAALELGPQLAIVRELSIDQPDPGAPGDRAEVLRIRFVVDGIGLSRKRRP